MMRIDSPDQAAVFVNPAKRRILVAFMARERSLSDVAGVLNMPMNRLSYHVSCFLRLGLLSVVREQKRAGRPIRYYRAVADSVLVSAEAMRGRPGDALAAELRPSLAKADRLAGHEDLLLSVDAEGKARLARSGSIKSDACEYWRVLHLSKSDAHRLAGELAAVLQSYENVPGKGRAAYLAHVAMAPRRDA